MTTDSPKRPAFSPALDAIAARYLGDPDVDRGGMLRATALRALGKVFAFEARGGLVLKLPRARVDALVAGGSAERFGPGAGRERREWVRIDPARAAEWADLVEEARLYVRGLARAGSGTPG